MSSYFLLDKSPLGPADVVSTGARMQPDRKLRPRLFNVSVNSGKGIVLHDYAYTKTVANLQQGRTVDLQILPNAATDKSGNGNHPTVGSHVTLAQNELKFLPSGVPDSDCYASIPIVPSLQTTSYSFFFRFKLNDFSGINPRLCDGITGVYVYVGGSDLQIHATVGSASIATPTQISANAIYDVVVTVENYSGGAARLALYVNGSLIGASELSAQVPVSGTAVILGNRAFDRPMNGSIYAFKMWDHALTAGEVTAISNGYKQLLAPSVDNANFALTQTSVKDLQFYIRNPTSVQEQSPTEVDGDTDPASFWYSTAGNTTLSNETSIVIPGSNKSLKIVQASPGTGDGIYHPYGTNQDWSNRDEITLYWYGANTGNTWIVGVSNDTNNNGTVGVGWIQNLVDNWTGWAVVHVLLKTMSVNSGTPSWTAVRKVVIKNQASTPASSTHYLDRVITDVCPSMAVKKASLEFYLDNQAEEQSATVLSDDGEPSFWILNNGGTGGTRASMALSTESTIKMKGVNSLKISFTASTKTYANIYHQWGTGALAQDWSAKDFIAFWWYSPNSSGARFDLAILHSTTDWANNAYYGSAITETWTGWRRIVVPLKKTTSTSGTLDWTHVTAIYLLSWDNQPTEDCYLDRCVVDVGSWAKVEIAVPDNLYLNQNWLTSGGNSPYDWSYWVLWLWNTTQSAYEQGLAVPTSTTNANTQFWNGKGVSTQAKFLDGTSPGDAYGESSYYSSVNCFAALACGMKGKSPALKMQNYYASQTIVYSQVGTCKNHIGFIIKMPPSDLRQSSTYGISQAKLKLEVYFP